MAKTWINEENMLVALKDQMNAEMMAAAEPVIRKAVEEAEKEMRRKLAAMFVSLINQSFSIQRNATDLYIRVENMRP